MGYTSSEVSIFRNSILMKHGEESYKSQLKQHIQTSPKDHQSAVKIVSYVLHHPQSNPGFLSACLMYSEVVAGITSSCLSYLTNVIQQNKINYFCNSRKAHSEPWNTKYTNSFSGYAFYPQTQNKESSAHTCTQNSLCRSGLRSPERDSAVQLLHFTSTQHFLGNGNAWFSPSPSF